MTAILEVNHLSKRYKKSEFALRDVSLTIPSGSIIGFIGQNGAGKSTTMGAVLGTLYKDQGVIRVFGQEMHTDNQLLKEDIGVVYDDMKLPKTITIKKLEKVLKRIYKRWNQHTFNHYIKLFNLPNDKKLEDFSRGMSMKLSVAVALSHEAKLLILDEATAGLDPSGREEVLDVLKAFVEEQEKGILMSSHITSDIEKIADQLVFIKDGEIVLKVEKEELLNSYAIATCEEKQYKKIVNHHHIVAHRKIENGEVQILFNNREAIIPPLEVQSFSIDDVTLLLMKGEKR
ncbi:ABC transporter ATP-binding protein [Bacillus sp. TS-2]|nr:ABC transporter ATP-binding protein [Bacillus sp. TS-2]